MALAKDPALLILDEPTTGLDATVEAEVLDLIAALQADFDTAVLFISHNLGVIRKMCERVGVLYAGTLVEEGPVEEILHDPRHPYTVGLIRCIPRGGARKDRGRLDSIPGFLPSIGEELPGLRLRRALRARAGDLPRARPRRPTRRARALQPLPLPRAGARAAAHDRGRARRAGRRRPRRRAARAARGSDEDLPPGGPRHPRPGGRLGGDLARRDARPGRRVRQRQDDAGAHAARPDRAHARDDRARRSRRCRCSRAARRSTSASCRSSSRTPTPRSTAATACGASCCARCASSAT